MMKMQRRSRGLNVLTGISLVLCTTLIVLWVRGNWSADYLEYGAPLRDHHEQSLYWVTSSRGRIWLTYYHLILHQPQDVPPFKTGVGVRCAGPVLLDLGGPPAHQWRGLGCARRVFDESTGRLNTLTVAAPHWFLTLLFALLPLRWAQLKRRSRRYPLGFCLRCGYDLRATPERCPECGAEAAEIAAPPA